MVSLFRRGDLRKEVGAVLDRARATIAILSLTPADVSGAEALIRKAEGQVAEGDLPEAQNTAERAEWLATLLEAEYRGMEEAANAIQSVIDRMGLLGLDVADEGTALAAVAERAKASREAEGLTLPDYVGARALAEEARARAEGKLARFERAGGRIFAAEVALEGATRVLGEGADALAEPRQFLQRARANLAASAYDPATEDATTAERVALQALEQHRRAEEAIASLERTAAELRAEGVVVEPVSRVIEAARGYLAKGKPVAVLDVLDEAAADASALGTAYRDGADALAKGTAALEGLWAEGLHSREAEDTLSRARDAVREGNYRVARSLAEDVERIAGRERDLRNRLREWIEETKARVRVIRDSGHASVADVEEVVARAERELALGDLAESGDDLHAASMLLEIMNGRKADRPDAP